MSGSERRRFSGGVSTPDEEVGTSDEKGVFRGKEVTTSRSVPDQGSSGDQVSLGECLVSGPTRD